MEEKDNSKEKLYLFSRVMKPSSARLNVMQIHGKRKSASENCSLFHPVTKQQITEARIASSMQRLNLLNQPHPEAIPNTNRAPDEGFFEDQDELDSDFDLDDEDDLSSGAQSPAKLPEFKLAPGVLDHLKTNSNDILPRQIVNSMNGSCLALLPYSPPTDLIMKCYNKKECSTNENQESVAEAAATGVSPKVASENEDEMLEELEQAEDIEMID